MTTTRENIKAAIHKNTEALRAKRERAEAIDRKRAAEDQNAVGFETVSLHEIYERYQAVVLGERNQATFDQCGPGPLDIADVVKRYGFPKAAREAQIIARMERAAADGEWQAVGKAHSAAKRSIIPAAQWHSLKIDYPNHMATGGGAVFASLRGRLNPAGEKPKRGRGRPRSKWTPEINAEVRRRLAAGEFHSDGKLQYYETIYGTLFGKKPDDWAPAFDTFKKYFGHIKKELNL